MHSTWCDGNASPVQMVEAAISKGFTTIGFSSHGNAWYDKFDSLKESDIYSYCRELKNLKQQYEGRINIFCGIEQDSWSLTPTTAFDYVIGSVHYILVNKFYAFLDLNPDLFAFAADEYFKGDYYSLCEEYYRQVATVVQRTDCDIIGHMDLVSKFNEKYKFFDENHPRYVKAWQQAADTLLATGRFFEINTGIVAKGWRSNPFPAPKIIAYLKSGGARFVLSGDAHRIEDIGYGFEDYADLYKLR